MSDTSQIYQLFLAGYVIVILLSFVFAILITKRRIGRRPTGARDKRTAIIAFFPMLWVFTVFLFVVKPESADWFWKVSFFDINGLKIIAVAAMIGAIFLNIAGIAVMGESFRMGIPRDEKTKLITTGIFHYIRNPGFLALDIVVFGTFIIIPNLLTILVAVLTILVYHFQILEEEKHLMKLHGTNYEVYMKKTGRYFPKLFRQH